MKERLVEADSIIFIAMNEQNTLVGFAQLYPSFSSVAMKRTWILNDLYVEHAFRQQGVATALLHQVDVFAKFTHADSIKLSTEVNNGAAKALYESKGYRQLNQFDHYIKRVD
ncbi:GNAT family N-acetyltransferase [Shewanella sp. ENK2]|uniref:GNAT family N-acetyltransferase n=1 Tax=Shewanella sp. ENK2 TaxID=2775245 RepID=UPI00374813BC